MGLVFKESRWLYPDWHFFWINRENEIITNIGFMLPSPQTIHAAASIAGAWQTATRFLYKDRTSYDNPPPQGLSEARRSRQFFGNFSVVDHTWGGAPSGAAAVILKWIWMVSFFWYHDFHISGANSGTRSLLQSPKFIGLSDPFEMNLISKIYRITTFQISREISSLVPDNDVFSSFVKST